jgi:hypothetical protein
VFDGHPYVWNQSGVFNYHAELVSVESATTDGTDLIQQKFGGNKKVFLLGQNSQNMVFFVYTPETCLPKTKKKHCAVRATIRIPGNGGNCDRSPVRPREASGASWIGDSISFRSARPACLTY